MRLIFNNDRRDCMLTGRAVAQQLHQSILETVTRKIYLTIVTLSELLKIPKIVRL